MGTGCDTTLAQIAAEVLECPLDNITTLSADTDWSPYDSGSYASSTTYVTGKATEKCALELRGKICALGAKLLGCDKEQVSFDGREVRVEEGENAGYFAWSVQPDGTKNSFGAAPDGEEFFAMALFFAAHRWGDGEGIFNYSREAKELLHTCIHKGENGEGGRAMWDLSLIHI